MATKRESAGAPTGGQFAAGVHPESDVGLDAALTKRDAEKLYDLLTVAFRAGVSSTTADYNAGMVDDAASWSQCGDNFEAWLEADQPNIWAAVWADETGISDGDIPAGATDDSIIERVRNWQAGRYDPCLDENEWVELCGHLVDEIEQLRRRR